MLCGRRASLHSQYRLSFTHYHQPGGWNTNTWSTGWYITSVCLVPKPVFSTTTCFHKGSFGLACSDPKSREAHPARGGSVFCVRGMSSGPLVFLIRPSSSCCCGLEAGRQGDGLDCGKGRVDEKLFHRKSRFSSDYLGIIWSTKS